MFYLQIRWSLDSNFGPLELEATSLPTEPQPLPINSYFGQHKVRSIELVHGYLPNVVTRNFSETYVPFQPVWPEKITKCL